MSATDFLKAVLGVDGAQALEKAADRVPVLDSVLVPRTIVAWLGSAVRVQYEGEIPGVSNSYFAVQKSERDLLSGAVTVGDSVHSFEDESLLYVAAALGVALGVDGQKLDPSLRGQDLSRLGKSIDLLVRGRFAARLLAEGEPVEKAIGDIAPGKQTRSVAGAFGSYDYNHVLQPAHHQGGFQMQVEHYAEENDGSQHFRASLHHPSHQIQAGSVKATFNPHTKGVSVENADLHESHQGKGLGSAMYEAVLAHAKHHFGATHVVGSVHSSMASAVHNRLSQKHGLSYQATPTPYPQLASPTPGPNDARHDPYQYALKEELDPTKPKPKALKKELLVTKSESERKCTECGGQQFARERFVGCLCFRGLAKGVKTVVTQSGDYHIKLVGGEWDEDSVHALVSILKE
jgi:GNAT superfamily N-acetyltransferase